MCTYFCIHPNNKEYDRSAHVSAWVAFTTQRFYYTTSIIYVATTRMECWQLNLCGTQGNTTGYHNSQKEAGKNSGWQCYIFDKLEDIRIIHLRTSRSIICPMMLQCIV